MLGIVASLGLANPPAPAPPTLDSPIHATIQETSLELRGSGFGAPDPAVALVVETGGRSSFAAPRSPPPPYSPREPRT